MLTKQQQEFLLQNKEVIQKVLPFKKQILEKEKKKTRIDKHGKILNKKDDKQEIEKRKKIKELLEKMSLTDIERFEKLVKDLNNDSDSNDD
jgi:hypothetical protein